MIYETLEYTVENEEGCIRLNRPDAMNALNLQMRAELIDVLRRAKGECRALAITGAGDAFCAGQDLGDGGAGRNADYERVLRDEYLPLFTALTEAPMPIIAAVNGPAAGAGVSLAMACDVVIAKASAYFHEAYALVGLIPDSGASHFLPRRIGLARAMGTALFAERIDATKAYEWGLIWKAIPDDAFDVYWRERLTYLAEGPSLAFAEVKALMRESFSNSFEHQFLREASAQGRAARSRDHIEGVMAHFEKRSPKFEGR